MLKKLLVTTFLSTLIFGFILFHCNLPEPPPGSEDAKIALLLKSSDGKIDRTGSIQDSVGKEVQIGIILYLTQYIDSSVVRVSLDSTIEDITFSWSYKKNMVDTVFFPITFTKAGTHKVDVTGYITDQPNSVDEGKIIIYGPPQANKSPELKVPGTNTTVIGQAVSFLVSASDPDIDQIVILRASQKPESATFTADTFKWTPATSDTGTFKVIFIATDNGVPVMSDTDSVTIYVRAAPVNRAPQWNAKNVQRTTKPEVLFSYELRSNCSDQDNDSITFTLISALPVKDTIIGTTYSFTPTAADTGKHTVRILAKDPPGLADTLTLGLTVSTTDVPDNDKSGPVITLINPVKDSITINTFSCMVIVKITDPSGVLSVNGTSGETAYTGVRDTGSLWKINISALGNNKVNAIVLTATDSSLKANKTLDTVFIKSEIVNGFKIEFDKNDSAATGTMVEQTINSGDSAKLSENTFVKTGSIFAGWMTVPIGTTIVYVDGALYKMGTSNVTLYAKWTRKTQHALIITAANGSVTKSPDAAVYDSGTVVTLTPVPSNDYHFSGWSGALTGTANPATITMNDDKSVTAGFEINRPNIFTLTVTASNGTVQKMPDFPQYDSGTVVTLTATPSVGYQFTGWSGGVTGSTNPVSITMTGEKSVTAAFAIKTYALAITSTNGSVVKSHNSALYDSGIVVTLTATPVSGFQFTGWNGDLSGTTNPAYIIMNGTKSVTANFAQLLTVNFNSQGGSPVSSQTVLYSGHATTPSAPSRNCYDFAGWYKEASCVNPWDFTNNIVTSTPTTLFANWTSSTVTVTNPPNVVYICPGANGSISVSAPCATTFEWHHVNHNNTPPTDEIITADAEMWGYSGEYTNELHFTGWSGSIHGGWFYCKVSNGSSSANSSECYVTAQTSGCP